VRESGTDLVVSVEARQRVFLATSLPDWPGWVVRAERGGARLPTTTVNHAFVGFWLPPGQTVVRLGYCPDSFRYGVWSCGLGAVLFVVLTLRRRQYQI